MVGFLSAPFILTGQAFDPASLFTSGEVGDWWLGGTPYTTTGQTVVAGVGDAVASLTGTVNGTHLIQANSVREPTLAANNLLTFGGTHGLYSASAIAWASEIATLAFVVNTMDTTPVFTIVYETENFNFSSGGFRVSQATTNFVAGIRYGSSDQIFKSAANPGGSFLIIVEYDNTTTAGNTTIWEGATDLSTTIIQNDKSTSGNLATSQLNFGARQDSGGLSNGVIATMAPVFAISRSLTTDELNDVVAEVTRLTGIS